MKLRHFVFGSSAILVGWLAVTFVYDVPAQRYPKLGKYPATSQSAQEKTRLVVDSGESADSVLSVSR